MSRVANAPIAVPSGVDVTVNGQSVQVKGPKGTMNHQVHASVEVALDSDTVQCKARAGAAGGAALAGTTRALVANMVVGVHAGFEKKLELVGVGYRAQMKGSSLSLALGYSHPIDFEIPEGVTVETPSQTVILVKGVDKQKVGQTAANIRSFRPPEPYKGKGVKYSDEYIQRKEAKKK